MKYHHICIVIVALVAFFVAGANARFVVDPITIDRQSFEAWTCQGDAANCVSVEKDGVKIAFGKAIRHAKSLFGMASTWTSWFSSSRSFVESFSSWKNLFSTTDKAAAPRVDVNEIAAAIRGARKPRAGASNTSYPFFSWIPMPKGDAVPDGPVLQFSTPCFGSVMATATQVNATYISLTVTTANQLQWFCSDAYLLFAAGAISVQEFDAENTYTIGFNVAEEVSSASGKWFLEKNGIRFLKFRDSLIDTVGELLDTLTLLSGFMESPIPNATMTANIQFIQNYIEASPRLQPLTQARTSGATVGLAINQSYIQSGDALFVLRPDGLDPMIGWGEGDTVGHSVIALWINGQLNVCESTTKDAYWPTNGIQCHPYVEWIHLCEQAQHNVVHVPLAPQFAALFDATKAYDFFLANEGLDYGFQVFLYGWLDVANDNFPCVPDDYTTCLTSQVAEFLAVLLDKLMGGTPENIFRQALQHRVGKWPEDVTVLDSIMIGSQQMSMNFTDLYTMIERDDWLYNTTRNGQPAVGKAMVCCVFVCSMWKAAGVFGNLTEEIQCAEQTLWDIFSMQIFDNAKMGAGRPEVCQQYDPNNQLCQLTGNLTLHLEPDVNTRPLYAHMGERCSSLGPAYVRPAGC